MMYAFKALLDTAHPFETGLLNSQHLILRGGLSPSNPIASALATLSRMPMKRSKLR